MKRVLGILIIPGLAFAIGCAQSYDLRVEEAIKTLRYKRDLEKNTEDAPKGSNLKNANIWIRPPKGLKGPTQTPVYPTDPGKFDINDSFIDTGKQVSLHILARTNAPKQAGAKKAAPNPANPGEGAEQPAARGDFTADVLDFVKTTYSTEFDPARLKPVEPPSFARKSVSYKGATIDAGDKQVKIYFHGDKNGPAQVALIFEGPKDEVGKMTTFINYSLNSLALGTKAQGFYNGGDEFAGDEAGPPPTGVF